MDLALVAAPVAVVLIWLIVRSRRRESIYLSAPALSRPAPPADLDNALISYALFDRDTEFFGPWRECRINGVRVAFQGNLDELQIEVGNFDPDEDQICDIYLSSVRQDRPKPPNPAQHLDPFVGAEGQAIADRYYLNATGPTDYPQLERPAVREALRQLSDTVDELAFYESGGFSLSCLGATRQSVESDVVRAVAVIKALETPVRGQAALGP